MIPAVKESRLFLNFTKINADVIAVESNETKSKSGYYRYPKGEK